MLIITEIILGLIILFNIYKLYQYSNYLYDDSLPSSLNVDIRSEIEKIILLVFVLIFVQILILAFNI
jgi:hypothetical protein